MRGLKTAAAISCGSVTTGRIFDWRMFLSAPRPMLPPCAQPAPPYTEMIDRLRYAAQPVIIIIKGCFDHSQDRYTSHTFASNQGRLSNCSVCKHANRADTHIWGIARARRCR